MHEETVAKEIPIPAFAIEGHICSNSDEPDKLDVIEHHVRKKPVRIRSSPQVRSESVTLYQQRFGKCHEGSSTMADTQQTPSGREHQLQPQR